MLLLYDEKNINRLKSKRHTTYSFVILYSLIKYSNRFKPKFRCDVFHIFSFLNIQKFNHCLCLTNIHSFWEMANGCGITGL